MYVHVHLDSRSELLTIAIMILTRRHDPDTSCLLYFCVIVSKSLSMSVLRLFYIFSLNVTVVRVSCSYSTGIRLRICCSYSAAVRMELSGAEVMHTVCLLAGCYAFALAICSIPLVRIWLGYVDAVFVLIFVQDLSCRTVQFRAG